MQKGKEMEDNNRSEAGSPRLIFRTESSPPLLTVVGVAVANALVSSAAERGVGYISDVLKEIVPIEWGNDYQRDLFGFLRTAEFVVGTRHPSKEKPYSKDDLRSVKNFIKALGFGEKPEVETKEPPIPPKLERHICSFGSPVSNEFCRFLMEPTKTEKTEELEGLSKDLVPELPYTFNYRFDPRAEGCSLEEIRTGEWDLPLNYSIKESASGEDVYVPMYDPASGNYVKDYLMMVKVKSIHKEGRMMYGSKNLIVAGCHEVGTKAGKLVIQNEEILEEIYDEVGTGSFQAIFEISVEEGEPERAELLKVKSL